MGVIIWQMLTLQPLPYPEQSRVMAVLEGVRDGTLDLRSSLPLSAPWALLAALAHRCLDPDPSRRPSCSQAMQVLDDQCHYARNAIRSQAYASATTGAASALTQSLLSVQVKTVDASDDDASADTA
jgi:hypothetical protein